MPNKFRQGLAAGGLVMLLGMAVFVARKPATGPIALGVLACYCVGALSWLVGSVRDRVSLGVTATSWNRAVALGTAVFTVGWAVNQLSNVLYGSDDPVNLSTIVMPLTGLFFVWFAVECWVEGMQLDEAVFQTQ